MTPIRIQRQRIAGWKNPPNTRYCGRDTRWGNRHRIGQDSTRADVLAKFNQDIESMIADMGLPLFVEFYLLPLTKYENLSCFCPLSEPCHVDIWIRLLKKYTREIAEVKRRK